MQTIESPASKNEPSVQEHARQHDTELGGQSRGHMILTIGAPTKAATDEKKKKLGMILLAQLVIAAITTAPSVMSELLPLFSTRTGDPGSLLPNVSPKADCHVGCISFNRMRS